MTAHASTVRLERWFHATPERMFAAWTEPALLARWMFGPAIRDEEIVHLEVDPRPGGAFSFLVRREGQEFDHVGVYLRFERPHHLSFTWGVGEPRDDASRVELALEAELDGVSLTLVHVLPPEAARFVPQTQAGWMRMLGALAPAVEDKAG